MKGGVALALGVMRELAERPELYAEVAVLLVNDEEWRTVPFAHTERFPAGTPASASRPARSTREGHDAVIVQAQGGRHAGGAAHGAAGPLRLGAPKGPQRAARAGAVAQRSRPRARPGRARATDRGADDPALRRGVQRGPAARAAGLRPARGLAGGLRTVLAAVPASSTGSPSSRCWCGPGRAWTRAPPPRPAGGRGGAAGAPAGGAERGGASDASHIAQAMPAHRGRPRAARRRGPHAARVGRRRVAAHPRGSGSGAGCGDPRGVTGSLSGAFGSAHRHPAPHGPVRPPRERRREARSVRRMGHAGAVRGHPRRARAGAHARGHVRRLAHGPDRDLGARRGALPAAPALQRRVEARRGRRPVLGALSRRRRRARRPVHLPAARRALPDGHQRGQPRARTWPGFASTPTVTRPR